MPLRQSPTQFNIISLHCAHLLSVTYIHSTSPTKQTHTHSLEDGFLQLRTRSNHSPRNLQLLPRPRFVVPSLQDALQIRVLLPLLTLYIRNIIFISAIRICLGIILRDHPETRLTLSAGVVYDANHPFRLDQPELLRWRPSSPTIPTRHGYRRRG